MQATVESLDPTCSTGKNLAEPARGSLETERSPANASRSAWVQQAFRGGSVPCPYSASRERHDSRRTEKDHESTQDSLHRHRPAGFRRRRQAADNFVGLTWGETSNNIQKSKSLNRNLNSPNLDKVIDNTGTWGIRAGQQFEQGRYYATYENISDTSSGNKLRQQNLLGSYDAFLPIGDNNTKLFGGATLGLVKLEQDGKGFKRDSDVGYAAGLQAGILQELSKNASIEGGYRYLRTNASTEMTPHGGNKLGSLDLHSSSQFYLGANYKF